MPFTIRSNDLADVPERQSVWYSTDIAILTAALAGTGVLTGCAVTAQGSPDMTLAVASGTIQPSAGAAAVNVTAGNVNISAAHATLPRIDLVTAAANGTKTVIAGTASGEPKPPDLPSGHIALAMVDVPAAGTTIGAAQITDKRAVVFASSAGGGVTVEDEGTPLATVADTLDFVGGGVIASGTGTTKTISISGAGVSEITDIPTAEMDDALVLAPDGAGGVEFRAEIGGGGGGGGSPADVAASLVVAYELFR